jgi:feruloyl esterase
MNATGNGQNKWMQLTYQGLANAYFRGLALQPNFSYINTDDPDLSRAKALGAKIISYHGWSDVLIPPNGSLNYYTRVSQAMGGDNQTSKFNRLFMIPGMGHCSGVGSVGPDATANSVPLPATDQFFDALMAWVEKNDAPKALVLKSADASVSLPVCSYPQTPTYKGHGPITEASSYNCK